MITGSAGGTFKASFKVEADLDPFERQVEEAVHKALVKFKIVGENLENAFDRKVSNKRAKSHTALKEEEKKWVFSETSLRKTFERGRDRMKMSFRMTMTMMWSQVNQLWSVLDQMFGLGKNMVFQIISTAVSSITTLIATAYQAAAIYAAIPGGQIIAGIMIFNAVSSSVLQANTIAQAAAVDKIPDTMGNIYNGGAF
jgi:hypothetical protein